MKTSKACALYLSRYEVGGSLWRALEGQLLPGDHHHLGARARLVDVGGRHGAGGAAGRDASGPAARRQARPVGVVGLERRRQRRGEDDGGKNNNNNNNNNKRGERKRGKKRARGDGQTGE